jgi:hypothetical protein
MPILASLSCNAQIALHFRAPVPAGGRFHMPTFTVVASSKDGKTVEHEASSATKALHQVHELRGQDCHIVTIYRDGTFVSEDDLVIEANAETEKKHKKKS